MFELCCGYEPKPPDHKIDLDYMEHLVNSYERWEQMECYNDLMARLRDAQSKLSRKWLNGEKTTPQEQGAASAFDAMTRLVEFNKRRLMTAIQNQRRLSGEKTTRAQERVHERMNRE